MRKPHFFAFIIHWIYFSGLQLIAEVARSQSLLITFISQQIFLHLFLLVQNSAIDVSRYPHHRHQSFWSALDRGQYLVVYTTSRLVAGDNAHSLQRAGEVKPMEDLHSV